MHQLKEEFTDIFDQSENLGYGTLKLLDWFKKAEKFLPKSVKTIKNWFGLLWVILNKEQLKE